MDSVRESKEYQFASQMAQFLESLLQEKSTNLNKYLNQTGGALLCHCFAAGNQINDGLPQGDRIFEVDAQIKYE